MKRKKILHLTLTKQWFDLTASGVKKIEYRERKPHWEKRLTWQSGNMMGFVEFDEIHYRNGYSEKAPFCRVVYKGTSVIKGDISNMPEDSPYYPKFNEPLCWPGAYYVIINGPVLEVKNWSANET